MRKSTVPVLVLVCLTTLVGVAAAVRPSGPGQTTKSASLSVAVASDQVLSVAAVASSQAPQTAGAVTLSDAVDAGFPSCTAALVVGTANADGGVTSVAAVPCGGDAGVTFKGLSAGSRLPGCFSRILSTGTTAADIVCQAY